MPRERLCFNCSYCENVINVIKDLSGKYSIEETDFCHKKNKPIRHEHWEDAKKCKHYIDDCRTPVRCVKNRSTGITNLFINQKYKAK